MKRFFPIVLTLMLILTLAIAGCGGGNSGGGNPGGDNPGGDNPGGGNPGGGNPDSGTYTVTFNSNGGSAVVSQEVSSGGLVTKPADPTKSGYTFGGWYKEAELKTSWNFTGDTVTANTTLYAKWDSSGGTLSGYVSIFTTQDTNASNVQIEIISNGDTLVASTYTDASGNYSISNIPAGTYTVKADFHSVTNSPPPAPYTVANGGSYYFNNAWSPAWGWGIDGIYNHAIIGTAKDAISISNGINTTIKFRLQVDAP